MIEQQISCVSFRIWCAEGLLLYNIGQVAGFCGKVELIISNGRSIPFFFPFSYKLHENGCLLRWCRFWGNLETVLKVLTKIAQCRSENKFHESARWFCSLFWLQRGSKSQHDFVKYQNSGSRRLGLWQDVTAASLKLNIRHHQAKTEKLLKTKEKTWTQYHKKTARLEVMMQLTSDLTCKSSDTRCLVSDAAVTPALG